MINMTKESFLGMYDNRILLMMYARACPSELNGQKKISSVAYWGLKG